MTCHLCTYAAEHGWWGPDHIGTHCRTCHRTWAGKKEAHCMVCHLHFGADSTADLHEPYCTDDSETTRKRLLSARRSAGKPVFAVRDRKHGEIFVRWSPDDADGRWRE